MKIFIRTIIICVGLAYLINYPAQKHKEKCDKINYIKPFIGDTIKHLDKKNEAKQKR